MTKVQEILHLIASTCSDRFQSFSRTDKVVFKKFEKESANLQINQRSEIIVYGVDLTIRFQVFYSDTEFQSYIKHLYDDLNVAKVRDFFNEVCNLTLGKIKEIFVEQGIIVALSLPVNIETDFWQIEMGEEVLPHIGISTFVKDGATLFILKCSVEAHRKEVIDNFKADVGDKASAEGEVEFF